ncbi:hypothetical protein GQ457_12G004050 [Hibiscus cannabinus]
MSPNLVNCSFLDTASCWILDSGATDHVASSLDFFTDFFPVTDKFVSLPNGKMVKVLHIGVVRINSDLVLTNVLHIPFFSFIIVSVSRLASIQSRTIGIAKVVNGLYQLQLQSVVSNAVSCNVSQNPYMLDIWHLRLGHPSKQRMKFFSFMNKAIPATYNSECDTCHLAKHKMLPFQLVFQFLSLFLIFCTWMYGDLYPLKAYMDIFTFLQ